MHLLQTMMQTFEVNTVGTYLFLRAVSNSLRRAAEAAASGEHQAGRPKVVVMGSRMGSVGHHSSQGGGYAYRASKAALNAVVKSLSVDVPEVIWTVVHPGRVKTGLVDIEEEGAMSVEESIGDCVRLIERLEVKDSGTFVDRFGQNIPW